jgi:chromosome segregation ATPase
MKNLEEDFRIKEKRLVDENNKLKEDRLNEKENLENSFKKVLSESEKNKNDQRRKIDELSLTLSNLENSKKEMEDTYKFEKEMNTDLSKSISQSNEAVVKLNSRVMELSEDVELYKRQLNGVLKRESGKDVFFFFFLLDILLC